MLVIDTGSAFRVPSLRIRAAVPTPSVLGPVVSPGIEWKDGDGRIAARTALHAFGVTVELVGLGTFVVADGSDIVDAWPAAGRSEEAVSDGFTRSVLPLILQHRGAQYLHASAIVTPAGVVALCGRSGTGKSTMAAALERRGYAFWGDDAVVFRLVPGGAPVSVRLPSALRLDHDAVGLAGSQPDASALGAPSAPGDVLALAAVVVLDRGEPGGRGLVPLAPGPALSAVLEHALCFSLHAPSTKRRMVEDYVALVASVPVRRLVFAPDRERFRSLVESLSDDMCALATP